jgi:DNA-binding response OmpR family regulator
MSQTKVLLVDDEPDIVETVQFVLQQEGYDVVTAADGPAALAAYRSHRPDIILLDVMLPGVNGYRVARTVREEEAAAGAPVRTVIILVTARDLSMDPEGERESKQFCDPDLVVYKPFDIDDLLHLMAGLLRHRTSQAH